MDPNIDVSCSSWLALLLLRPSNCRSIIREFSGCTTSDCFQFAQQETHPYNFLRSQCHCVILCLTSNQGSSVLLFNFPKCKRGIFSSTRNPDTEFLSMLSAAKSAYTNAWTSTIPDSYLVPKFASPRRYLKTWFRAWWQNRWETFENEIKLELQQVYPALYVILNEAKMQSFVDKSDIQEIAYSPLSSKIPECYNHGVDTGLAFPIPNLLSMLFLYWSCDMVNPVILPTLFRSQISFTTRSSLLTLTHKLRRGCAIASRQCLQHLDSVRNWVCHLHTGQVLFDPDENTWALWSLLSICNIIPHMLRE